MPEQATPPPEAAASDALAFWERAVAASPATRDAMLASARKADAVWATAMLQSLNAETGGAGSSTRILNEVLARGLYPDQAMLTRLRLRELDEKRRCETELGEWQERAAQIVEIEQDLIEADEPDAEADPGR